jgi:phosphatidylglycerophosphate synthase
MRSALPKLTLPNVFTLSRVACVPVLWVLAILNLPLAFGLVLLLAGLTDVLDGVAARWLRIASVDGAKLDSFADNLLSASLVFWLWLLIPEFITTYAYWCIAAVASFALSLLVGYVKYGRMIHYHLYMAKAAEVFIYAFAAHATLVSPNALLFFIAVAVVIVSQLEEMAVTFTHKRPMDDRTSKG